MTIAEFIEAFGAAELRRFCNVGASALSNWKKAGKLPAYLHYDLAVESERRKIRGARALFGKKANGRAK